MAWSAPMTAVNNAVLTAAQWNTYVRDNLNETAPAKVTQAGQLVVTSGANQVVARTPQVASVQASEATVATSFGDLTTFGPQVTVTTGTTCMVIISTVLSQNTATAYALAAYDVTGATTTAAASSQGLNFRAAVANQQFRGTYIDFLTNLTPGENTFTMRYQALSGTALFAARYIMAIPFS
jgi:hypothetical protein